MKNRYILTLEKFVSEKEFSDKRILSEILDKLDLEYGDLITRSSRKDVDKDKFLKWLSKSLYLYYIDYYKNGMNKYWDSDKGKWKENKDIYNRLKSGDIKMEEVSLELPKNTINNILDYTLSPLRTKEWKTPDKWSLEEAYMKSEEWHKSLKATGVILNETGSIFMRFPDGFYWIDLETNICREEGEAMGHCASTRSDTLLSLRDSRKSPHVTASYNYDGYLSQLKGKNNKKPVDKYHQYIKHLFIGKNSQYWIGEEEQEIDIVGFEWEYDPENDLKLRDFNKEDLEWIVERNEKLKNSIDYFIYKLSDSNYNFSELIKGRFKDLHHDEENNLFYLEGKEIVDFIDYFENSTHDHTLSHDAIYSILNWDLHSEGYFDPHSFMLYDWDKLSIELINDIISDLKSEGINVEIVNKNIIYKDSKVTNFNVFSETEVYDNIERSYTSVIGDSIDNKYYDSIYDELESVFTKIENNKYYLDENLLKEYIKDYHDNSGEIDYQFGYNENKSSIFELIEEVLSIKEKKIEVSVPYYGHHGDFDPKYFEELYRENKNI